MLIYEQGELSRYILLASTKTFILLLQFIVLLRQVILNPKLRKKGNRTAFFFEGCLRWDSYFHCGVSQSIEDYFVPLYLFLLYAYYLNGCALFCNCLICKSLVSKEKIFVFLVPKVLGFQQVLAKLIYC